MLQTNYSAKKKMNAFITKQLCPKLHSRIYDDQSIHYSYTREWILNHSGPALERGVLFRLPPCFSLAPVNFLPDEITSNSSLKASLISILTLNKMSITILLSHCSWQMRDTPLVLKQHEHPVQWALYSNLTPGREAASF